MKNMKNQKSTMTLALVSVSLVLLLMTGIFAETGSLTGSQVVQSEASVKIKLSPERQKADDEGLAFYKIEITDLHSHAIDATEAQIYEYELKFIPGSVVSREGDTAKLFASFHQDNKVVLKAGETVTKEVKVQTEEKGRAYFVIEIQDEEGDAWQTKGIIVSGDDNAVIPGIIGDPGDIAIPGIIGDPLFQGTGFILNEDESEGYRIDLALLEADSGNLKGKITIDHQGYKIEGTFERQDGGTDVRVKFDIVSIENDETYGSFLGTVEEFERLVILRGTLSNFESQDWKLTAIIHSRGNVIPMKVCRKGEVCDSPSERKSSTQVVSTQDDLAVQGEAVEDEIFVKPIQVRERKIFWIIPTGENEVELEITKGDQTFRKKIREHREAKIEGYQLSVGSLVDEENIEFSIEKAE